MRPRARLEFPGKVDTEIRAMRARRGGPWASERYGPADLHAAVQEGRRPSRVEEGKSLTEVATHLGIARSLLQRWREQLTDTPTEAFPGRGRSHRKRAVFVSSSRSSAR